MTRKFTKYPSNYVKTNSDISSDEISKVVDEYVASGATWSLVVAELKGIYGLEKAKEIADMVDAKKSSASIVSTRSIKSSRHDSYDESTPKAHWEARADFADGTSLEFNRPCTVTGWQNEDERQEIESDLRDLLRRATEMGKEVVFYTVNFVLDE